jgi:hypothetical protein
MDYTWLADSAFMVLSSSAVIGEYIVAMMEGNLDPELLELWSGSINGNEIYAEVMPHRKLEKRSYERR